MRDRARTHRSRPRDNGWRDCVSEIVGNRDLDWWGWMTQECSLGLEVEDVSLDEIYTYPPTIRHRALTALRIMCLGGFAEEVIEPDGSLFRSLKPFRIGLVPLQGGKPPTHASVSTGAGAAA